ncbi:YbaB/EbfC family nucleoid-associated protein [Paractinoplanes globisporus]|uniref:YbaB/EbfC family nucleoid-associated protein n=1 Tax=Paractinoplanes globisporus TaxID=113565 RepID=A0ABW6WQH7_9ACTN|nr:YbaB/EbfC family nucleoid-associated protein [Actinoplanes globisporus]
MAETADRDANQGLRDRLAEVYGQYARLRSDLDDLQQRLAAVRVSCESDDGLVRATVGPRGQLVDLSLDQRIFRDADGDRLARTIVATVQEAAAQTAGRIEELMVGYLPADSGTLRYLRDNDFSALLGRYDRG